MCKKAVKKIFGGGGSSKPKAVVQETPPAAVSVSAPTGSGNDGAVETSNDVTNVSKKKGKNLLKISRGSNYTGLSL